MFFFGTRPVNKAVPAVPRWLLLLQLSSSRFLQILVLSTKILIRFSSRLHDSEDTVNQYRTRQAVLGPQYWLWLLVCGLHKMFVMSPRLFVPSENPDIHWKAHQISWSSDRTHLNVSGGTDLLKNNLTSAVSTSKNHKRKRNSEPQTWNGLFEDELHPTLLISRCCLTCSEREDSPVALTDSHAEHLRRLIQG